MNFRFKTTKVFAYFFSLFALFISANAQINSSIYQIPPETIVRVRLDNEINSKTASVNDTFTTVVAAPVSVRDAVVLPTGTIIEGRITKVRRASFGGRNGYLEFVFETLRFDDGQTRRIEAVAVDNRRIKSSPLFNVLSIGGGTAAGAAIGAASGGESGTFIGAALGAGAGTSLALLRKGKDASIKTDEEFEIKLTKTVNLPVQDF